MRHQITRTIRTECANLGISVWGWHVPFCKTESDAKLEADLAAEWVVDANFSGLIIDAERTKHPPRFQGGRHEAQAYVERLNVLLQGKLAFSSHDRPSLHNDLPFSIFIDKINDVLPQVYYKYRNVSERLEKSMNDYASAGLATQLKERFKPTGNISVLGDLPVGTEKQCIDATKAFIARVKVIGLTGYSFWCWDDAPEEIWPLLAATN
ncbi:hypothetical protein [Methylocystis heyeri]|uniref:Uncharacterized protein n=1 Tax=Methylocystis heyeri TaxID=391905 RepID=A0A6B8KBX6_9HYPH|nr:hypothetical protein [Methylocystis heyeri]QGM45904.1 hypothetical protein H2LOC_009425 [Methylocystis heyeri]